MAVPIEPAGGRPRLRPKLTSGVEVLDKWSRDATQVEKNLVHQVLFSMVSGSLFAIYDVIDDVEKTMEFFVLAKFDLTVKLRVHGLDSFGIIYIGPTCSAPGLDRAASESNSSSPDPAPGEESSPRRDEQSAPHRA
jgi:hypothetical protein